MPMLNDRPITISVGSSRKATHWPAQTLLWSELVAKLAMPTRSTETLDAYLAMPKGQQDELKDVGGYVAGVLAGPRRKVGAVTGRDVLTLDLDNIPAGGTEDALRRLEGLGCAYTVHSTRKHMPSKPRLRVLIPLNRMATADEYEPIARRTAEWIGMDLCDPTTFDVNRLMYWPSVSADSLYIYHVADKPFLHADGVLATYSDWRNVSEWPVVPGAQEDKIRRAQTKQGDPLVKDGLVGAFCRVYDIYRAIDELIPGAYIPADDGRYTYAGGSTSGGAVIYDDGKFLYSHHATDPCSGRLVNAFDLVRLHRFADLDDEAKPDTPAGRLPSYTAMKRMAVADPQVALLLQQERYNGAIEDFDATDSPNGDPNWLRKLALDTATGRPEKTTDNVLVILENDPLLRGKIVFDEFSNRLLATGALPWDARTERRIWADADDAGLRHYLEHTQDITGKERIFDGVTICAQRHKINDVQDYLTSLVWDGNSRLDTIFVEYLGAEDNIYTRAVTRKSFVAAVARAMVPGCKYDTMPILSGPQGIGKSTLLRYMGRRWYSESLDTFEGKEAAEMLQGTWINEIGELNGMSRSESSAVKNFLSRVEDVYREPYGRRTGIYPRRCVFFGTTNDSEYLRDHTGGRRFWPVDVGLQPLSKSVFKDLPGQVDQLWAEAFVRWQLGEPLYLEGDVKTMAEEQQEAHREVSSKEGMILEFVERPVPLDWDKRDSPARRIYWTGEFGRVPVVTMPRQRVCAAEVWVECFGGDLKNFRRQEAAEINAVLGRLQGWKQYRGRFGSYGPQRGYENTAEIVDKALLTNSEMLTL